MSTKTATLAKSLHTVTALVRVAQLIKRHLPDATDERAIIGAMDALGYGDCVDPYGLEKKALAALAVTL